MSLLETDIVLSLQIEKEEQAAAEKAVGKEEFQGEWSAPAPEFAQAEGVADWSEGVAVPSVPIQQFPAGKFVFPSLKFNLILVLILQHKWSFFFIPAAPAVKTGEENSSELFFFST